VRLWGESRSALGFAREELPWMCCRGEKPLLMSAAVEVPLLMSAAVEVLLLMSSAVEVLLLMSSLGKSAAQLH